MTILVVVAAVLAVVALAGILGWLTRRVESTSFTVDEAVDRLEVVTSAGSVEVGAGDGPVHVERRITHGLFARVRGEPGVPTDGVLRLGHPCVRNFYGPFGFCQADYRVTVPAGTEVDAKSSAGGVRVDGISGRVRASSSSGSVTALRLEAARVELSTSAGSIEAEFDTVPDDVTARTSSGHVTVVVPKASYRVDASSSAGKVEIDVPTDPDSPRRIVAHSSAGGVAVRPR